MLSWSNANWAANALCACCKPQVSNSSTSSGTDNSTSNGTTNDSHNTHDFLHRNHSLAELRRKAQEHSTASALLGGLGFPGGLPLPLHLPLLPPLLGLSRRSDHQSHLPNLLHQIQPNTKDDP